MKRSQFSGKRLMAAVVSFAVCIAIIGAWSLLVGREARAAAPIAGTVIGNQASATYTDASLINRTATSNTVTTIVQQVASLTLTASQSRTVAPGGTVYFPHTVTNTGNGTDTISLGAVDANTGAITFSSLVMYADADGNGVPDNATQISSTGALAAGGVFRFVVAATVPGTATSGQSEAITVTAVSGFNPAVSATPNTDTVNVSGNAVIAITKALSISSGPSPSSGQVTVTLTYTNTGNSSASNVTITDVIGTGTTAGMTYVLGSGGWSGGATVTDAVGGDSAGLDYSWNAGTNTVTAIISSVAPVTSGTITFRVTVNAGLSPGSLSTANVAAYSYNDGVGSIGPVNTNIATYTVVQTGGVVANGSNASSVDGIAEPVTVASAIQGATVSFGNYIWNTGNGTDSFDMTIGGSSFPAGTTFQLYRSDGVTPLTDSNANGIPDTGPLASGANYLVILKATLPASVTGGPYSVTKTATSFFDNSKSNQVIDTLTTITSSSVDLTNNTGRTDSNPSGGANAGTAAVTGFGAGPGAAAIVTNAVNPGASTVFVLYANNTSAVADSYDLLADNDGTFGAVNDLSAGWSVVFNADGGSGNCSTLGAVVTNTGVINAGANKAYCATITVPAGQPAGSQPIYFRVASSTTGAADPIWDQVTVNAIRSISLTPNNSGQIYPGGSVVYAHTISNAGNVIEGNGVVSTIVLTNADSLAGWNSIVYYDLNNNGALDAGDPVVPAGGLHLTPGAASLADGLGIGESARLFVKVFAPAGAAIGEIDTSSLTATTSNNAYTTPIPVAVTAQDTTQVIAGQVRIEKTQALDAACDGTPDGLFSNAVITTGAVPGACIRYQIVATNDGTAPITSLVISDATPPNSTYDDGSRNSAGGACGNGAVDAAAATSIGTISAPVCNAGGTIQATVGSLNPGQSVSITFGVMIDR